MFVIGAHFEDRTLRHKKWTQRLDDGVAHLGVALEMRGDLFICLRKGE